MDGCGARMRVCVCVCVHACVVWLCARWCVHVGVNRPVSTAKLSSIVNRLNAAAAAAKISTAKMISPVG